MDAIAETEAKLTRAEAAARAERARQAVAHRDAVARSPHGAAARLLGVSPTEVAKVEAWGSRSLVTTRDGVRYVIVPPDAPDVEGRFGVMTADRRVGGMQPYSPHPGEVVPAADAGPLARLAGGQWRRPKLKPTPTAAEVAEQARAKVVDHLHRTEQRLAVDRADLEALRRRVGADSPDGYTRARLEELQRSVGRGERTERALHLELEPPAPSGESLRFMRAVKAMAAGMLVADSPEDARAAVEAAPPAVMALVNQPGFDPRRELEAAARFLAAHDGGQDGPEAA